ncbi:pyridoxamine 5'-phosphate oxidase family protein [Candidatus Enterococcus courvalinii]|uniref:Pyridoxamine 5'-phosphate oxidase family protein n=1 Tax=Candidatus Enterococcus courvalinii TaxID=2815329 RepID=A0ABS3HX97_9ENTE|nr:pyridoxamine 5'-phosphate oxidase family protein [Enterococcus sp. MSG2901]MBO0481084.1 pyridoxamine 5'-phosphate oxidase family protein [Enterococcus sp. MSG2901]
MNETFLEVMKHEGAVTIISSSEETPGFHAVNTWNSYVQISDDKLYIPAAGMHSVQQDIEKNNQVMLTVGSKEVIGTVGLGAGFHLHGTADFIKEGPIFDEMKEKFPFLSRVLQITVTDVEQKI